MTRHVLVTGASKGIGRAIAIQLAQDGFTIAVHYMSDQAGAETTLAAIINAGGKAEPFNSILAIANNVASISNKILLNMVLIMA